jgi:hypothetical protein
LLGLFFDTELYVLPKCRFTFNGIHGVISQKIEPCITTALRTSGATKYGLNTSEVGTICNAYVQRGILKFILEKYSYAVEI